MRLGPRYPTAWRPRITTLLHRRPELARMFPLAVIVDEQTRWAA